MIVLAVSRSAQRGTSGMIEGLASCFTGLEDPRETRRCDYQLVDILVIAVCAVIACAESWEDIELGSYRVSGWSAWEGIDGRGERLRMGPPASIGAAHAASGVPVV